MFCNFMWINGPDTVNRKHPTTNYDKGGLRMIYLQKCIAAKIYLSEVFITSQTYVNKTGLWLNNTKRILSVVVLVFGVAL